jgi:hypothetical protein
MKNIMRSVSLCLILFVGLGCKQILASSDGVSTKPIPLSQITNNTPIPLSQITNNTPIPQSPNTNITLSCKPGFFPNVWTYKKFYGIIVLGLAGTCILGYFFWQIWSSRNVFQSFSKEIVEINDGKQTKYKNFEYEILNNRTRIIDGIKKKINLNNAAKELPQAVNNLKESLPTEIINGTHEMLKTWLNAILNKYNIESLNLEYNHQPDSVE